MVTGLYAGILALVYMVLSINVVARRVSYKMPYGDGGDSRLAKAVRIHGNFAEYVPFALILMALYEMQAGSMYTLHIVGCALIVARFLHIIGLNNQVLVARAGGTVLTMFIFATLGILLVLKGIRLLQVV